MPRLAILITLAIAIAAPACAADLAARRGGIGVIFADPVATIDEPVEAGTPFFYAPQVYLPPLVNGYYGKPNSYYHNSYYGTSPVTIFTRLPYACGWHGYC
ncbi:MAG: hypothetical protein HXX15_13120 [Rhodopseudomonas sp.]|uniref:hypothetical protein n=1 Tax=Rhodopseudomonas sp. TaxID=1078 RepID=UPI0018143B6D|nr:hypothetical protein [Rhodopseudomonas sp.]NVN87015.1 hypothetical protein [Rhodopseudomonas sp.]